MEEIHRGPEAGGTGRQLQGGLTIDPKGRLYPASSRNLKPPALAGGVFTPGKIFRRRLLLVEATENRMSLGSAKLVENSHLF